MSAPRPEPIPKDTYDRLRADYATTIDAFKMLTDLRFKLLTIVPTLTGLAVSMLSGSAPKSVALAVGVIGMVSLVGIMFYDLRNTQFYDAAVHRARALEKAMGTETFTKGARDGGLFNERPGRELFWWGKIQIWHDRSLYLVYGASVSGWAFVIVDALLSLVGAPSSLVAVVAATATGALFVRELHRLERVQNRPQPVTHR